MNAFGIVFLAALALATAARLWLALRHVSYVRAHRGSVPSAFAAEISLDMHYKAADYTCAKTRLAMVGAAYDAAILLALTFGGALQWLHEASAAWLPEGIGRGLLLLVLVGTVMTLLELPFGLYRTFVIENRFGFNKMTPALYFLDFAKSIALAAAFGLPLGALVLWLMAQAGEYWWFYAWLTWVAFNTFMVAVYPTWIAPLFNRFLPLQDAELKARVERLMARCGFKLKGLMVMDGSRRTTHGNAYFTGFGTSKRIVFFDTLLARLNPGEVEAVLAHELGHFKLRHVVKRMAWLFAASLAFLWLLGWIMQQPWFYDGLNVQAPSTAMAPAWPPASRSPSTAARRAPRSGPRWASRPKSGARARNVAAASAGAKATTGRAPRSVLNWPILSRRKARASAAACAGASGGQRRVFTAPGAGALAMIATAGPVTRAPRARRRPAGRRATPRAARARAAPRAAPTRRRGARAGTARGAPRRRGTRGSPRP